MAIGTQTVVVGSRTTHLTSGTSMHIREVDDKIKLLTPYPTPIDNFFMINEKFTNVESKGIRSKFEWYEDAFLPQTTTLTAGLTGGAATEASVAFGGDYFRLRDMMIVEATGNVLVVTARHSSGVYTVASVNGSNITAAAGGSVVQRLASSHVETGSKGTSLTVVGANKYGYCQIMKRLISMSNRQSASAMYGGNDWDYQWKKALLELREEWERAMLNQGAAYDDTSSGATYSAGFKSLSTNAMTYSTGSISKTIWDSSIKQCFQNGSTFELDAYCGGEALMDIAAFIQNLLTIHQTRESLKITSFGLLTTSPMDTKLVEYIHPMGKVNVYFNPQLRGAFSGNVVFINRENIKKRFMGVDKTGKSRKYRLEMGIQTPGEDTYDAQYLLDQGLQIILEETHGRLEQI